MLILENLVNCRCEDTSFVIASEAEIASSLRFSQWHFGSVNWTNF